MDLYDWLLALHVLAAAALVSAEVLFTAMIIGGRNSDIPSSVARLNGVSRFGTILVGVGSMGVLILGIALAIQQDAYQVWDPWILAAIVLWAIFAETGRRVGAHYGSAGVEARDLVARGDAPSPELRARMGDRRAQLLHAVSLAAVLLLLIDMIYKPGA